MSEKYSDVTMDFADATLIMISEFENIKEIITIDSEQSVTPKPMSSCLRFLKMQ